MRVPEKNDIVTDVCKRCIIGGVSMFKWDERGAQVMRERNKGGCDRPRPFSIIAILAVVVLTKCRGSTVTSSQGSCFSFSFYLISLIADGPHHYHPACGH